MDVFIGYGINQHIVVALKLGDTPMGQWQFEQLGKLVIKDTILRYAIFGLQKGFQKLAFWL
jgi:hypothetical protein